MTGAALTAGLTLAQTISVDFSSSSWERSQWLPVREERFPVVVPFVQRPGWIENSLPAGASEKDIVATKDGMGVAMMLWQGEVAADVSVRCEMAFERKGAPAIQFRTQREGEVTGETYSLVLYEKGLNLWKFSGGKWVKVGASQFPVTPGEFHEVRLLARGPNFWVSVDGQRRLGCTDPSPLPAGEVGLWSGEGPCRFRSFRYRPLDR